MGSKQKIFWASVGLLTAGLMVVAVVSDVTSSIEVKNVPAPVRLKQYCVEGKVHLVAFDTYYNRVVVSRAPVMKDGVQETCE